MANYIIWRARIDEKASHHVEKTPSYITDYYCSIVTSSFHLSLTLSQFSDESALHMHLVNRERQMNLGELNRDGENLVLSCGLLFH